MYPPAPTLPRGGAPPQRLDAESPALPAAALLRQVVGRLAIDLAESPGVTLADPMQPDGVGLVRRQLDEETVARPEADRVHDPVGDRQLALRPQPRLGVDWCHVGKRIQSSYQSSTSTTTFELVLPRG